MCVSKCVSEAAPAIMDAEAENIVNANATLHLVSQCVGSRMYSFKWMEISLKLNTKYSLFFIWELLLNIDKS